MRHPLCIYHANCADGFTAAWAVWRALGKEVEFFAGTYQAAPPEVKDRDVILVDFSYKFNVLLEMAEHARSVLVLDHHKSAAEDLSGLPSPGPTYAAWLEGLEHGDGPSFAALFDMERSGAGIAWDFFHEERRPSLVEYVEDRDLWRWALSDSRAINANIFSHAYDFSVWDDIAARLDFSDESRIHFIAGGEAIERKQLKDVGELVALCRRRMVIGGHDVPVASIPYTLSSDAGHLMAKGEPFAACYWDTPAGRVFSLRASDEGLDVSKIAKGYGGGGHTRAAGFTMPIGWEGDRA